MRKINRVKSKESIINRQTTLEEKVSCLTKTAKNYILIIKEILS